MNRRSFFRFLAVSPLAVPMAAASSSPANVVPMDLASGERIDVGGRIIRVRRVY